VKNLLIVGAGGFGREVLNYAYDTPPHLRKWEIGGFLDSRSQILDGFNCLHRVVGDPETYEPNPDDVFICALGDGAMRLKYGRMLQERGAKFVNLASPTLDMSADVRLGVGCIFAAYVGISTNVTIGDFVVINSRATVGHDAVLGAGCTLSAHCDVGGGAVLEEEVFMGSHAVILPKAIVGQGATVGAGSVVLRRVRPRTTVMGVPAKQISGFDQED
jgi:sugar O-acyltransferase (sialic acid O-acetyltransferase NeuD family)